MTSKYFRGRGNWDAATAILLILFPQNLEPITIFSYGTKENEEAISIDILE